MGINPLENKLSYTDILPQVSQQIPSQQGFKGPKTENTKFQQALSYMLEFDLGRTSYFQVDIFGTNTEFSRNSKFLCHSAELPGETSGLTSQKIYGVVQKFPLMTAYNDITLSFLTHGSDLEKTRTAFLQWLSSITGRQEIIKGSNNQTTYNLKYKDSYSGGISIIQYAITGDPLLKCELVEAFPIAINQSPLSWASPNNIQNLNVTFAFTEYQYSFYNVNGKGNYTGNPLGELNGSGMETSNKIKEADNIGKNTRSNPLGELNTTGMESRKKIESAANQGTFYNPHDELERIIAGGIQGGAILNSVLGAIKSGNPAAILSNLPRTGLSDFTLSSILNNKTGI